MAVQQGYGKMAGTDALVFAYDTGDAVNSYKGKPATNHLRFINQQYTPVVEDHFILSNGSHEVNVPTLGTRTVKYVDIWNDYSNGSGRCCLSLFSFGTGITTVSPNTTYMYQIVYKTDTGYSHPNYMYRYEYGASGYIKEGGLHSTGRRTHLGDGWYHAWGSFTTDANTTYLNTYLFHYEYATQNKVQVAQVMLTEGSEVIPPRQFIDFEQTRSATEGLLDLTGDHEINLVNAGFDSNSEITFDATDDKIITNYAPRFADFTVCIVFKDEGSNSWGRVVDKGYQTGFFISSYFASYGSNYVGCGIIEPSSPYGIALPYDPSGYHFFTSVREGSTQRIYLDGIEQTDTKEVSPELLNAETIAFGRWNATDNSQNFNGKLPIVNIYDRALTPVEIQNNFNRYKTRFNIA